MFKQFDIKNQKVQKYEKLKLIRIFAIHTCSKFK